jgi:hypothetical protein
MRRQFDLTRLKALQEKLNHHPIYAVLTNIAALRCFMMHHVFSVWDFMSLIKYLQKKVAPTTVPWYPQGNAATRYFINSLVLEEESDEGLPDTTGQTQSHISHFELYCQTMREMGADTQPILQFLEKVKQQSIETALKSDNIPAPARRFTQTTFAFIATDKPHVVAAALALGREHVIPDMFRAFLAQMAITEADAPAFHYYLKRHVHLDEDFHAPLSLQLLDELCAGKTAYVLEAEEAAQQAILARLAFWDEVLQALS